MNISKLYMRFTKLSLLTLVLISSCKESTSLTVPDTPEGKLERIDLFQINVTEPSGLSFGPGNHTLLIVSDNTNNVFETDLEGTIIRTLPYNGNDLEGVAYNTADNLIAVAEERKREVVILDYAQGNEQSRYAINVEIGSDNSGLEGISYNQNNNTYYLVNETLPGQMIVWNPQLDILSKTDLHFASDYSAIYVDTQNARVWIVSDQSEKLYECDYKANVLKSYPLERTKFEGIVVDAANKLIYLVNDATAELHIYRIIE